MTRCNMKTSERDDYSGQLQRANERYYTDSEFRERCKAASLARYYSDPDYAERTRARARARWAAFKRARDAERRCQRCARRDTCLAPCGVENE